VPPKFVTGVPQLANVTKFSPKPQPAGEAPSVGSHEAPLDPLLAFDSEDGAPTGRDSALRGTRDLQGSTASTRTISRVHLALAVLGVLILAQAGLIGIWLMTGNAVGLPDTGSVIVTSEPAGAPVTIDGLARGVTPVTVAAPPGTRQVLVGDSSNARLLTVQVARGSEAAVHLDLRAEPAAATPLTTGGLQISTEPSGARVFIDGEARGTAPMTAADLQPGDRTIRVVGAGTAVTRTVTVQPGTVSSLIIALTPGGASGWLSVSSRVATQISENGILLGTSEMPRIMLPAGRHVLELANAALEYREQRTIQVAPGETTALALDLPQGTLHVNALPWAEVWVDGQHLGETPLGNISLPIGAYEIVFRNPDLGEQRLTVTIGAATPVRVGVDLRKRQP
jgi:hypothetical protein